MVELQGALQQIGSENLVKIEVDLLSGDRDVVVDGHF